MYLDASKAIRTLKPDGTLKEFPNVCGGLRHFVVLLSSTQYIFLVHFLCSDFSTMFGKH